MPSAITTRRRPLTMKGRLGDHMFTRETVERALDVHQSAGRIGIWARQNDGHRISLSTGEVIHTNTLRESAIFVHGVGSAAQARPQP